MVLYVWYRPIKNNFMAQSKLIRVDYGHFVADINKLYTIVRQK